jgi:hypothetical protein
MSNSYWFSLVFVLKFALAPYALSQPWDIGGQSVITFADGQSGNRIAELNTRLKQVSSMISPNENWVVTKRSVFVNENEKNPKDPKAKPKTVKKLQSMELLLNNNLLLTVTEMDVVNQNAPSLEALANEWQNTLNQFFSQPKIKRYLYLSQTVPQQLSYRGKTYKLLTDVITDRGLFRTTGVQAEGRVIFWEVPANDRTYALDKNTKAEIDKTAQNPDQIFIFDPKLQFIAYTRSGQEGIK